MRTYEIRYTYGAEQTNWAGAVESEYREERSDFVDASTPQAAVNKLKRQFNGLSERVVSVERVRRVTC